MCGKFLGRVMNYPSALATASSSALKLGFGPIELARYLVAYTKNARTQLGSPERFHLDRFNSFETNMGKIYFRDNRVDPATLTELVTNPYGFTKTENCGAFVDIGACIGMAFRTFSFYNPEKEAFCFEPVLESFNVLKLNCPNAKTYNCAIGRERTVLEFDIDPVNLMAFKERKSHSERRKIDVFPLDHFESEMGDISMMKIDTEGSEVDVLMGAEKCLKKTAEVRMETHSEELHERSKKILVERGFEITKEIRHGQIGYVFAKKRRG